MNTHIEEILDQYDKGAISRRTLIAALAALGARSPASAQEPLIQPAAIDHVQLNCSKLEKSVEFYSRLLGQKSQPLPGNRGAKLDLGSNGMYLSLQPAAAKPVGIDHYCIRVNGYQGEAAEKKMAREGVKVLEPAKGPNGLTMIADADGIRVQISPAP